MRISQPLLLFVLLLAPSIAAAQMESSNEPLEVTADHSLAWDRAEQTFTATQNAIAKQGDTQVAAQALVADYREGDDTNFEIWRLTATNQVEISARDSTAYGQEAVYNLDEGKAVMTGDNLKLVSPDQTVTARDRFEYWVEAGRLVALGQAKATRGEDTLESDQIAATFKQDAKGQRVLDNLEAIGNVVITTPTEILTGDRGIYHSSSNTAKVTGNVQIRRGPNILEGARAEVDLTTNISTMYGAAEQGGRVRGVFYPGSTGDE